MTRLARAIHLIAIVALAAAVLAQPASAVPRVACVPLADCGPAEAAAVRPIPPARHACCPEEAEPAPVSAIDVFHSGSSEPGTCCVLTAGDPADQVTASAPAALPAPAFLALVETPADAGLAQVRLATLLRSTDDRAWVPPWQMSPEQGAGPRPPPAA